MAYAHQLLRGKGHEAALLRHHPEETNFGVQIAAKRSELAADAVRLAADAGAKFVDLNCCCPIYDTVKKGMGARLLQKPKRLASVVGSMVAASALPITIKVRTGFQADRVNVLETVQTAIDAGVSAISIHGRTREQRYSRTADWALMAEVAAKSSVPIYGNGDILTPMEAQARLQGTQLAGAMLARGALIKPWLFKEVTEGKEWLPTPQDFWSIICLFCTYLKEHFRTDELGRRRGVGFLAWQLDWFSRYRPLPAGEWLEASQQHPLLQTRSLPAPLLNIPGRDQESARTALAEQIWDSPDPSKLWEERIFTETPEELSSPRVKSASGSETS